MELIKFIFSIPYLSHILVALLSAGLTFLTTWRIKKIDYRNEYYKNIINKRLQAYQFVENQIAVLKSSIIDSEDKLAYHVIFSFDRDKFFEFQNNTHLALSQSVWLDEITIKNIEKLNEFFFQINEDSSDLVKLGKQYYHKLAGLRNEIEKSLVAEIYQLHEVEKFIKLKKNANQRLRKIYNTY